MSKWADYAIIAVRFKNEDSHIDQVKFLTDNGNSLENVQITSREMIVQAIENNVSFVTAYQKENSWSRGDNVGIIRVNHQKFIRTDGNNIEADNLGELPEF